MADIYELIDRKYHTNMYSDAAFNFFKMMKQKMTCASSRNLGYNTASYMNISREPDNEIVISFAGSSSDWYSRDRFRKTAFYKKHTEFLNWLGWYVINIVKDMYANYDVSEFFWNRSNTKKFKVGVFFDANQMFYGKNSDNLRQCNMMLNELSISDIYLIYDLLRNRKNRIKHYSIEQKSRIIGEPLNPIAAELERARRDEIQSLRAELDLKITDCKKNYERIRAEMWDKEKNEIESLRQMYEQKISDVNDSMKATEFLTNLTD